MPTVKISPNKFNYLSSTMKQIKKKIKQKDEETGRDRPEANFNKTAAQLHVPWQRDGVVGQVSDRTNRHTSTHRYQRAEWGVQLDSPSSYPRFPRLLRGKFMTFHLHSKSGNGGSWYFMTIMSSPGVQLQQDLKQKII